MKRFLHRFAVGMTILVICFCFGLPAFADGPVLSVDPADIPLHIAGILDGQTTSFSGNIRLTVDGADTGSVRMLASDLHHKVEPQTTIDRSNVTVPADISLSNGQPQDIKVTVSNVERAGDYTGTLQFLLPGQTVTQAIAVTLELQVDVLPDVKPVVADQSFTVVRCWSIECWMADILFGGSATRDVWHIQLDNQASQPVALTSALAVMHGARTAEALTPNQVMIHSLQTLPADLVSTVPVTIVRNSLLPDHYQGVLRFTVDGLDEPVTINSTLDVRNGPIWALVAIFLGIVVGRVARDMESPIAKKQVALLPRWYDLRADIDQITDEAASRTMKGELQKARTHIDSATDTEDVASKFLNDLAVKIEFLIDLQTIEQKLGTLPQDIQERAKPLVEIARSALLDNRVDAAVEARKKITDLILEAEAAAKADTMMGFTSVLSSMAGWLSQSAGPSLTESQKELQAADQRQANGWRRLLAGLSGLQFVTAETRLWFFRPLLSILLLVLLTLLGLQTLYVNSGAMFGAGGLGDYLGLFLWGITADVAQRTLLTLPSA